MVLIHVKNTNCIYTGTSCLVFCVQGSPEKKPDKILFCAFSPCPVFEQKRVIVRLSLKLK